MRHVCVLLFIVALAVPALGVPYQPDKIVPLPVPPNPAYTNYDSGTVNIGLYPDSYTVVVANRYHPTNWKEWYIRYTITPTGPDPTADLHIDYSDQVSVEPPLWDDFKSWQTYYGGPPASGEWTVVGYPFASPGPWKVNPQQADLVVDTGILFNPAWVSLHFTGNNVRVDYVFYDWCIPEPATVALLALGVLMIRRRW